MSSEAITEQAASEILRHHLDQLTARGYRIESRSVTQAVYVSGHRINHVLHFLLGIPTLGLWWIVWLILGLAGGERRRLVVVQPDGSIVDRKL
jgi:hypothetical protein